MGREKKDTTSLKPLNPAQASLGLSIPSPETTISALSGGFRSHSHHLQADRAGSEPLSSSHGSDPLRGHQALFALWVLTASLVFV